ncbi:shikimate kinase [Candidatus Gracilibacteria bacterium]|jgi:shikimate kinase|nr:shikimate kinase [Candidatus Gracilibacteria bacterium]
MIIALTGLRGSGKTKIGLALAEKLKLKFYDLDQEIEKRLKRKIKDLVTKNGWEYFRKIESEVLKKTTEKINKNKKITILSLGGGTIIEEKNAKLIRKNCFVIYLKDTPENCAKRISKEERPALTKQKTLLKEMKELYKARHKIYKKNADLILKKSSISFLA